MKQLKITILLQFIVLLSFGQNKKLSDNVTSRLVNEQGIVQQISFKAEKQPRLEEAIQVLNDYLEASEANSFVLYKSHTDELDIVHQKYQEYYQQLPVEFAYYTVHAKQNRITDMNGEFYSITAIPTTPAFSKDIAVDKAKQHINAKVYMTASEDDVDEHGHDIGYQGPNPTLVVFPAIQGISKTARLAYKIDVYAQEPLYRADVYIDALTGEVIFENNKIYHANVAASGTSLYNGNVNFTADQNGSTFRLRQTTSGNGVQTYDMNNGTSYANATDVVSNTANFTSDATAVQAHWGAEKTHSYYLQKHNRNSYDANGASIISFVSYSNNYVNAFWNGSMMTYGDGNGTTYGPLVTLDIVGHEITHGVVSNPANLIYNAESGALNESFADIFGEMIENHRQGTNDWMMSTDIGINQSGAFRSLSDPKLKGDPDTYQGQYWWTSASDYYRVNTNSGVQNKWFYILAMGETGTNDKNDSYAVTGIGSTKAAQIAYRNLTVYLSANSNYAAARAGAIQAAVDLFGPGSPEVIATTVAWYAVGVGNSWGNPPAPLACVDGNVTHSIVLDNYPGETSWDIKDSANNIVASGGNYST